MFCSGCGTNLPDEARFCMNCGKALKVADADQQAADNAQEEAKKAHEDHLRQELVEEQAEAKKQLDDAVTVVLVAKGFRQVNPRAHEFQAHHTYTFGFRNKTDKNILGVKGTARFCDLFGDEIQSITVSYDTPIPAGQSASWSAQSLFNQFVAKQVKLRDTAQDKLQFSFSPEVILFADGTKLP